MSWRKRERPEALLGAWSPTAVVGALVVGLVAYFSYLNRDYQLDDALIYYRYIRNCLAGHGLVYNLGERFNALTSPLHAYLSLVVCGLCGSIRYPMIALSGALTAAAALALFALYRPHEVRWPFVALGALLIAVSRYFYSLYGMETPLFLGLCAACVLLYERRRMLATGVVGALLVLARGEGALLLAVLCTMHLARHRPLPKARVFIAPALLLIGAAMFNLMYYGALLPHTLLAKVEQGRSGLWGTGWLLFHASNQIEYFAGSGLLLATSVGLALLGIYRLGRSELNAIILGFLALLTVFYVALNVPNYHWYYAPYYAFGSMYVGLGVAQMFDLAGRQGGTLGHAGRAAAIAVAAAILIVNAWATQTHPLTNDPRQELYPQIGEWLAQNTPATASVAMVEVGIIGYVSERRIVDILGLVSAGNAASLGARRFDEWLERDAPDFVLVHRNPWPQERVVVNALREGRYRIVRSFSFPGFGLLERAAQGVGEDHGASGQAGR